MAHRGSARTDLPTLVAVCLTRNPGIVGAQRFRRNRSPPPKYTLLVSGGDKLLAFFIEAYRTGVMIAYWLTPSPLMGIHIRNRRHGASADRLHVSVAVSVFRASHPAAPPAEASRHYARTDHP